MCYMLICKIWLFFYLNVNFYLFHWQMFYVLARKHLVFIVLFFSVIFSDGALVDQLLSLQDIPSSWSPGNQRACEALFCFPGREGIVHPPLPPISTLTLRMGSTDKAALFGRGFFAQCAAWGRAGSISVEGLRGRAPRTPTVDRNNDLPGSGFG